jgi:hypothetical protein
MTQQHPITPPSELVQQWREAPEFSALSPCVMVTVTTTKLQDIATQAAQWGADQELKACCEWLVSEGWFTYEHEAVQDLRAARRPKPPSLKEQAQQSLLRLANYSNNLMAEDAADMETIRHALEQLPDDK